MLSSFPPLGTHEAHYLWYPSLSSPTYQSSSTAGSNLAANGARNSQQHRSSHASPPVRTLLSVLRADEKAIELRKLNIQRFGSGWLKPPGVSKTLQGMQDEEAERREQEANGLRELEAHDAQTRLLEEQARNGDVAMLEDDESGMNDQERDLDDDIPDADEGHEWIDEEDGLPAEEGDGDYGDDQGVDMDAGMETRDLDDDVPEAGSYQHTDTDVEDESSDIETGSGGRHSMPTAMGVVSNAGRAYVNSAFGSSSPVAQRGGRRSGGGLGRGRGAEN